MTAADGCVNLPFVMKQGIHPEYFDKATITCACGNVVEVGSTQAAMKVDICANCHPFYTGKQKLLDKAGRVERFKAQVAKATGGAKRKPAK